MANSTAKRPIVKKKTPAKLTKARIPTPARVAADAATAAVVASAVIARATIKQKNVFLRAMATQLQKQEKTVLAANLRDIKDAKGLSDSLTDRLLLTPARMRDMRVGMKTVAELPDPLGETGEFNSRPSGIQVGKMRVPLGVILAIYESRPNVTADIAALAIKAGNAVILRGGGEARHSNAAIGQCLADALATAKLPPTTAQVITDTRRTIVGALLARDEIDLAVPRGGRGLIEHVSQFARMPVLKHLDGNCHVYVDSAADLDMAQTIVINAKTRRYGVCSAAESLLIHRSVAAAFLPPLARAFLARGVEMRGCAKTRALVSECLPANEADFRAEYLAPIISVKIVDSPDEAISHINRYGSAHTDAVVTGNEKTARKFLREVDSSSVMLNASTAFADGGEYGLGAEVGISTGKFHARGPVGLVGLTCEKYVVIGSGSVRA